MRALTVLCKVVDNFGDIGFVYRLSKNLCKVNPDCDIRIITNDVGTFLKLAPELGGKTKNGAANENCTQAQEGPAATKTDDKTKKMPARIRLFDSNAADLCRAEFTANPPRVILECFQCGRPDWLEEILFGGETGNGGKPKTAGATEIEGKTKKITSTYKAFAAKYIVGPDATPEPSESPSDTPSSDPTPTPSGSPSSDPTPTGGSDTTPQPTEQPKETPQPTEQPKDTPQPTGNDGGGE